LTQVDFAAATLAVTRAKHGTPSTHPLTRRELRTAPPAPRGGRQAAVRVRVQAQLADDRGNFRKLISRACEAAGLKIKAHPHMLRHACGLQACERGPRYARPARVSDPSGRAHPVNEARQKLFALRPSDAISRPHVFASSWLH
jgi:integrase